MKRTRAEYLLDVVDRDGKVEHSDFYIYLDSKWKTYSLHRKKGYISNFSDNRDMLIDYISKVYNKYAIEYHSSMTDMSIYFITNNRAELERYRDIYRIVIDTDDMKLRDSLVQFLRKQNITMLCNEYDDIDIDDIDDIIDYYSYRF